MAEVVFATEELDAPPTGVITDGCFRQVEFAGILNGSDQEAASGLLINYLLSPTFQEIIPLSMFVSPANNTVAVPAEYAQWTAVVENPVVVDPATIEENRDAWTERWAEIVLR